ncbi:MAG TPA: 3-deoxy-D-manno-octulosonic acid transferase [Candidatus Sulfotelmatobacter sp.]|nr:3-deoxy-D-manno-octulosonic acid transferase [Candidatus Sulfotelmatobacter sp.]
MGLAAAVLSPVWIWKGLRQGKYLSNLGERLGSSFPGLSRLPAERAEAIWIHAVSVGEVLSGVALAQKLKAAYPQRPLIISTTTQTGQALARERVKAADGVIYFPFDWAFCVRRALDAVRPALVIVLETEIWPNFLLEADRRKVPVIFVSGRISDKSFARYQKFFGWAGFYLRPFLRDALGHARTFLMQSGRDAERVRELGAPASRVFVSGNLKYDQALPDATPMSEWLEREVERSGRRPLIVAGSVVSSEEPLALIAFGVVQGEFPNALLVLAPRKPECFQQAADFIHESRRKFLRRSELKVGGNGAASAAGGAASGGASISSDVTVLLLDSIGELASLYQLADGAFVGGSLVESGGHNILEPAAFGKIPVFGPSMENFAEMASRFVSAKAAVQVESPEDAGVAWIELLRDPERQRAMSETAKRLVDESRGATARAMEEIAKYLGPTA